uniref:ATP synthase complex subunit 8 n=2 Tax=Rapisma TaxID=560872 RepID=V9PP87_9NEOP|nr:ATP synthase F0 subunit 8 [Rapisma xizangense]YP_009000264.1 ATP synthase F0 subunit 8 [Rapisma zayuanum]AHA35657.1 ATP synthase F0 subunit 8 [Rapisma xizangense]AHA35670.1 ATP synthase F0 subunit 8 [Rapisma zayuanum]ARO47935.1 ATP synthase F0 subunit 8 [Rapisma sp. 1 NS-2017]
MPQMSPLNWLMLFLIFIILFLLFNIMNYYIFLTPTPTFYLNFKNKIKLIWKW